MIAENENQFKQTHMTERELLTEKIRALNHYLSILTDDNWRNDEIGLPKGISRMEEIDRILDLILKYRLRLKKLKEDKNH